MPEQPNQHERSFLTHTPQKKEEEDQNNEEQKEAIVD